MSAPGDSSDAAPGGLPRRARLGAELDTDAVAFTTAGLRVAAVVAGGLAARAGVVGGDLITAIAGAPVRTLGELAIALRRAGAAATVELTVTREGVARSASVSVERVALAAGDPPVEYGALVVPGARLRSLVTRVKQPRAVVLVIAGIACESIEHDGDADAPLAALVASWGRAGFDSVRFDKRGVGDSESDGGPCGATDFATEQADAAAALALAAAVAHERCVPLVVYGHSVGGIVAARLAQAAPIAGFILHGVPARSWMATLEDSVRRQLALHGAGPVEVAARIEAVRALRDRGDLNGRSAAYHAQLAALDLDAAWAMLAAPVLVLRGEHDWVVRRGDAELLAARAPGRSTIVDLAGLDHLGGWHADRDASLRDYGSGRAGVELATATCAWLDELVSLGSTISSNRA